MLGCLTLDKSIIRILMIPSYPPNGSSCVQNWNIFSYTHLNLLLVISTAQSSESVGVRIEIICVSGQFITSRG